MYSCVNKILYRNNCHFVDVFSKWMLAYCGLKYKSELLFCYFLVSEPVIGPDAGSLNLVSEPVIGPDAGSLNPDYCTSK